MAWTTPKTSWAVFNPDGSRQYFNPSDYSRIIGNLQTAWNFLAGLGYRLGTMLGMRPMDYSGIPISADCNAVEGNLEALAAGPYTPPDYTAGRIFAGDGNDRTWDYGELNRIEGLTGEIYTGMVNADARTPFCGQSDFYAGNLML